MVEVLAMVLFALLAGTSLDLLWLPPVLLTCAWFVAGALALAWLAPRLRQHWHEQRAQARALRDIQLEVQQFSPDPAALAQGHRLRAFAARVRAAAWLLVPAVLFMWSSIYQPLASGILLPALLLVPASLLAYLELRSFRARRLASALARERQGEDTTLSATELELLAQIDRCAQELELDRDLAYVDASTTLAVLVSELEPATLERLRARGVDPHLLVQQLFEAHDPAERLTHARRRVLHHQLRKFVARAHGQQLRTPYRAELRGLAGATGLAWLAGGHSPLDANLDRTRQQLGVGVLIVAFVALLLAHVLGTRQLDVALELCVPGVDACRFALGSHEWTIIIGSLVALTPLWMWMSARLCEWAGELSSAFALPPNGELEPCRDTLSNLMWEAWMSKVQIGRGERALYRLSAFVLVCGLPLLAYRQVSALGIRDDLELALTVGTALGAGLLALRPLRLAIARLAARLCD